MPSRLDRYRQFLLESLVAQDRGDTDLEDLLLSELDTIWLGMSAEENAQAKCLTRALAAQRASNPAPIVRMTSRDGMRCPDLYRAGNVVEREFTVDPPLRITRATVVKVSQDDRVDTAWMATMLRKNSLSTIAA